MKAVAILAVLLSVMVTALACGGLDSGDSGTSPTPTAEASPSLASTLGETLTSTSTLTPTPIPLTPSPGPTALPTPAAGGYQAATFMTSSRFARIVDLAIIPGTNGAEAVVITQHQGQFWRVSLEGSFPPILFGDIESRINGGNEEGLLSLAFSSDYQADGLVYVYYTSDVCPGAARRCSYLSRFPVSNNDMIEEEEGVLLRIEQPFSNHNGGRVLFGPDGYLYLSLGDGGGAGDPLNTGQDNTDLLGSILRLDVSGDSEYRVPPDNPFVGGPGADEVYAFGLRNPWRFSFDRETGALWLADVGQASWEEVDLVAKGGNYGWNCFEGFAVFDPDDCPQSGLRSPRAAYGHDDGCSVTGGYVYRGSEMAELQGWYVYADFCNGKIWALNTADNSDPVLLADTNLAISSFAELPNGELLLLSFDNTMYRLTRR